MTTPTSTADSVLREAAVKKRVRWQFLAGSVVLIVIAALTCWFLVNSLQAQTTVIILRDDVARGEQIESADLGQVTIGVISGVAVVPAEQIDSIVGKRAAGDLSKGSLLNPDEVTDDVVPAAGQSVIGLQLPPGRVVSTDLLPGTKVRLVALDPETSGPANSSSRAAASYPGVVIRSSRTADQVTTLLDVQVDSGEADTVARLAAQDLIVIVQDGS